MRRVAMTVILGGVLLGGGSACGTGAGPTAPPGTATSTTPPNSAAPSPSVDYSADTRKICGQTDKIFAEDLKDFGRELGRMIAYKQAKDTARAEQTKTAAQRELKGIADAVREKTGRALDPELKAAGREAAGSIEATADQDEFYQEITTMKDLNSLEAEMRKWFAPLAAACT